MEDRKRWQQIPEFGNWDYCDEMPITQYFETARQAGLVRCGFFEPACEEDLFKVPVAVPVKSVYRDGSYHRKARRPSNSSGGEENTYSKERKQRKQGKMAGDVPLPPRKPKKAPKAVDEDLYKIPPELLYQKPKRKRPLSNLLSGCLGLNCVA
ncbi:hypothetical protein KSP39_PZI005389 [Platanthera zijinensis]|uniref:Uncharacterized protein n=1 Tax=Platanthera zijinensis TaxID=2320716 RepID=A0AAP0BRS8_9ASPA